MTDVKAEGLDFQVLVLMKDSWKLEESPPINMPPLVRPKSANVLLTACFQQFPRPSKFLLNKKTNC